MRFLSLFLSFCSFSLFAQYDYYENLPILKNNGDTLSLALAGGFHNPQFSSIDINQDGTLDVFVFDRRSSAVKCFVHSGLFNDQGYTYQRGYQNQFPLSELSDFVLLRDYNCDGHPDIFAKTIAGIKVYQNNTDNTFSLVSPLLLSDYGSPVFNLYNSNADIPVIDDIDSDGDLDILAYDNGFNQLTLHENASMDFYQNCDSLHYVVTTRCWGDFAEAALNNNILLDQSCEGLNGGLDSLPFKPEPPVSKKDGGVHAGSTLLALDYDHDGDKDLITGDISFYNAVYLQNGGDADYAVMDTFYYTFPEQHFNDSPAVDVFFPAGFYLDVNNDDKKDLLFASNSTEQAHNTQSAWLYENTGITDSLDLRFKQTNFLQDQMLDVGQRAYPVFFDYNNDGLQDLVIGNRGYYTNTNYRAQLMLLENVGQVANPVFQIVDSNFADVASLSIQHAKPTFADLDNDGDQDMVLGDHTGRLHYFENIASNGNTANFQLTSSVLDAIDVGDQATPHLFDFNDDGAYDLLIGERDGSVFYFENTGTPSSFNFSSIENTNMLGGVDALQGNCCLGQSVPYMSYDEFGDKILFLGTDQRKILVYSNIVDANTNFTLIDSILTDKVSTVSSTSIFGVANDVLAIGEEAGGIHFMKKNEVSIGLNFKEQETEEFKVLTNPVVDLLQIKALSKTTAVGQIFDLRGSLVKQFNLNQLLTRIDLSALPVGVYTLNISSQHNTMATKIVLMHNN